MRILLTPLAVAALLVIAGAAVAQTDTRKITATAKGQNRDIVSAANITNARDSEERSAKNNDVARSPNNSVDDRLRALEEELLQQKQMLTEMRELIADQRRVIEGLSRRSSESKTIEASESFKASAAASDAPSQPQTLPLEDRVKKLEGKVLAVGPFRFSGDFRLRFDGIFRKADATPPAGLAPVTHQQNARMRYRLRFNFDTDVDSKISFHGQLATGPVNNALTMDQEFGETAVRHPFFISEAWIDYHPNKAVQLQAGRLQEVFADNSRFLFDDDIRFNGFNEKYTLSFKNNGLKVSSLELRAGQYILSNPNVAIFTTVSPLAQA